MRLLIFILSVICFLPAHAQKRQAKKHLVNNEKLKHQHIGISIYDPAKDRTLYEHNAARYFTVASNNKLYTLYSGQHFLKDSTSGIQYQVQNDTLYIRGTGDPTFLHPDFEEQPVFDFLKSSTLPLALVETPNKNEPFAPEWAWDYYNAGWQPERSAFPIYGNNVTFAVKNGTLHSVPAYFETDDKLVPDADMQVRRGFYVQRDHTANLFRYQIKDPDASWKQSVPYVISNEVTAALLQDTLHKPVVFSKARLADQNWRQKKNVPLDSLLKIMMHRSDNFFAEQTQAMASMTVFNEINTRKMLDHLVKNHFKFSDTPVLKDGSGLSFADLSSPNDLITVLKLLKAEMDEDRLYEILATGNTGTLEGLYKDLKGRIHAKTGTLNKAVGLSGFLITKKNRLLYFSVVINGLTESYDTGRKQTEKFLEEVYNRY